MSACFENFVIGPEETIPGCNFIIQMILVPGYELIDEIVILIDYHIDRGAPEALTWPSQVERFSEAGSSIRISGILGR